MTSKTASWTILVYIAAHNNLYRFGKISEEQIKSVGSTSQVKLAVLYDGYTRGEDGKDKKEARRYFVGAPGTTEELKEYQCFDSGDPEMLIETAKWAFERHPAEHYGIVLWSHGTGYWNQEELKRIAEQVQKESGQKFDEAEHKERAAAPGSMALFRSTLKQMLQAPTPVERAILFDDGTQHSLDTLELERVMVEVQKAIGQPLDLLGFDACLMANIEVAYQLRNCVRCMVASEELMPATSWPYGEILSKLQGQPEMTAENLARMIVNEVAAYYDLPANEPPITNYPPTYSRGDMTQIAIDLTKITRLTEPLAELSRVLLANMHSEWKALSDAHKQARLKETRQGARKPTKYDFYLVDFKSLIAGLAAQSNNRALQQIATDLLTVLPNNPGILAEEHRRTWFDDIGGLSIYLPWGENARGKRPMSLQYYELAWAKNSGWGMMLKAYQKTS